MLNRVKAAQLKTPYLTRLKYLTLKSTLESDVSKMEE